MVAAALNPWFVSKRNETLVVPVAIEVASTAGADKQVREKINVDIDDVAGPINVLLLRVNWSIEMNGCEASSTRFDFVVPIARNVNATVWSPGVSRGNPDPVLDDWLPVTG